MRCNRCGNPLDPRDTRCSVCGRTLTPPRRQRSSSQKTASQKPSESHIKLPQLDKFTYAYAQDADRSHRMHILTFLCVVVCVVLLVMVFRGTKALKTAVEDLKTTTTTQLQAIQQAPAPTAPQVEDSTQTETEPTAPAQTIQPLNRQRLKASLTLHRTKDRNYAVPAMDLGTFEGVPTTHVSTQWSSNQSRTDISWTVSGEQLDLLLEEKFSAEENTVSVTLQWAFGGETFGAYGDLLCTWECRTSAGSEWGAVPTDCIQTTGTGSALTLDMQNMDLLLAQYSEMELRCLVSLAHPAGGTMSVTVDGITLGRTGLVAGW